MEEVLAGLERANQQKFPRPFLTMQSVVLPEYGFRGDARRVFDMKYKFAESNCSE